MRKRKSNIFLILILIVGLSLLLYPPVSNWWNSYRQSKVVSDYAENVSHLDNEEYQRILNDARAYNEAVAAYGGGAVALSDEQRAGHPPPREGDPDEAAERGRASCPGVRKAGPGSLCGL